MPSPESQRIRATLTHDSQAAATPLEIQRQEWNAAAAQVALPPDVTVEAAEGIAGEWVSAASADARRVVYHVHGGGYTSGSCVTHRDLAARLSQASGARVLLLDYRLAPEHPFPAAIDDTVAGYEWLLAGGTRPQQIVISGDSAGGTLVLAALLRLRDRPLAQPAGAVLISAMTDLTLSGASIESRAAADPLVYRESLAGAIAHYLGGADPRDPLASPLFADLRGLPALLIQVGADEVLLDDSTRLAERARAAGVQVTLEVWEAMWHVWHGWAAELPEAHQAIARIGAFVRERT